MSHIVGEGSGRCTLMIGEKLYDQRETQLAAAILWTATAAAPRETPEATALVSAAAKGDLARMCPPAAGTAGEDQDCEKHISDGVSWKPAHRLSKKTWHHEHRNAFKQQQQQ